MRKRAVSIIAIISTILSPLLGGLVGKIVAASNILRFSHAYLDDAICLVGMLAWMAATAIFLPCVHTQGLGIETGQEYIFFYIKER